MLEQQLILTNIAGNLALTSNNDNLIFLKPYHTLNWMEIVKYYLRSKLKKGIFVKPKIILLHL